MRAGEPVGPLRDEPPWVADIRSLLYPVIFEKDPVDGIDRVLQYLRRYVAADEMIRYAESVALALASASPLATVLEQPPGLEHSEAAVRRYLAEVATRLTS